MCENHCERVPQLELEEEEERKAVWRLFWFGTFAMVFTPLGVLLVTKTLKDEWYIVTKAYKFTVSFLHYIVCPRYSYIYRVYQLYDESKPFVSTH